MVLGEVATVTATSDSRALREASLLFRAGQMASAEQHCRDVLRAQPQNADALHMLGRIVRKIGRPQIAVALLNRAIAIDSAVAAYHDSIGCAHFDRGAFEEAAASFRRALHLQPDDVRALRHLGIALIRQGALTEATACFRQALQLQPDDVKSHYGLGSAFLNQGLVARGVASFRRAHQLDPNFIAAHDNLAFVLHYDPEADRREVFEEALAWGTRHGRLTVPPTPHPNAPIAGRRLRVGYVSADLHRHPVGYFLEPVLVAHDPGQVEVFCYANDRGVDDLTARLRAASDHWRSLAGLDDTAADTLIRQDAIDILVDLSGHTAGNRLPLFARKPAPVQATWLGYFDTTGLPGIDYLIADGTICPPGDDPFYTEQVVRLPEGYLCYRPQAAPPVAPPPALALGHITFGCFNKLAKITPPVVALWAAILRAVPNAQLALKDLAFADPGVRDRYGALFADQGVMRERVQCLERSPHAEYLAAYAGVDIALDPFPFNGGTTTVEALWMGVPVVTLLGDRYAGRMGASHLTAVGLEELIAVSPEEYVRKATALAGDLDRLAALRRELRPQMAGSPLCDGPRFTQGLEAAYRAMWAAWCRSCAESKHEQRLEHNSFTADQ